mmetsp:Transcript_26578/g.53342  ORF Transcript_26578/g.53342 Transcript_26578/m.53342 type:complete len:86 (-) Transcript_26578:147-404(-)
MGHNTGAFTGNKVTRKNTGCDRPSHSGLGRSRSFTMDKKNGAGKGNWGRPGDEDELVMDFADPSYDPLDMEYDIEQALREHELSS